jgi:hypothetical protein
MRANYNAGMRATLLLIVLLPLASWAQAPLTREPDGEPRKNQKIERLHHEDAGSSIEEVRVGGQVQSVTVQPKAAVPAYELPPNDMARSRPNDDREGLSGRKQRVWNVFNF